MVDASEVTAVIVTRGDVDLGPIIDTLPYQHVVWDNSVGEDLKVYGRYYAALYRTTTDYVYFQDDDVIFTEHEALMAAYEPGKIVANMDHPWVVKGHYDDMVMVGAGSICQAMLPAFYLRRYLDVYPLDDLFLYECDFILGTLAPWRRVDLGYTVRQDIFRDGTNRLCDQPWQEEWKAEARRRAREIRDAGSAGK